MQATETQPFIRQVHGSFPGLVESGPPGAGFYQGLLSSSPPELHWSDAHNNRLFQGSGPVKQLAFDPSSAPGFRTSPPFMGGSHDWFQRPKQAGYSLASESPAVPLPLPIRTPPGKATNNSWSKDAQISECFVPHSMTRQQLVAPRPGIATAKHIEDSSALWQQRGHQEKPVHHGLSRGKKAAIKVSDGFLPRDVVALFVVMLPFVVCGVQISKECGLCPAKL